MDRFKGTFHDMPTLWIDVARAWAIIATVGLLYSPTVASVALITTYVAFVASGQAVVRLRQVFQRPAVYLGLVFLGVVLIGVSYASVPWSDRWIDVFKWRTMLWFIVILSIFDEERWKRRLMLGFVVGATVGLIGSFAAAGGWITFRQGPNALLRNYVTQGMGFAVAALVCFWMLVRATLSWRMRWLGLVLGLLFVSNIVFITTGRSGYVVLGLGLVVLLLGNVSPVQRFIVALGLSVAATLVFTLSPPVHDKVTIGISEWEHETESPNMTGMGVRRVFYVNTLEILKDHWLLGVGTGGFRQAYTEHVTKKYEPSDWRSGSTGDPHNQYLAVFAQHGIGGLAAFLAWIFAIARDEGGQSAYRKLALAVLCGWCVTSLFSSHFRTFAEGHLMMTFLGALLAAVPPQGGQQSPEKDPQSSLCDGPFQLA